MINNHTRSVAAIMTCFNRKEKTLRCLETLYCDLNQDQVEFTVYLVDDGCTDGTAEAVKEKYPNVNILQGTGDLFWNMGMRMAFQQAVNVGYDFYLWVNDDVMFVNRIIEKLLITIDQTEIPNNTILVGYTTDESGKKITYGGYCRKKSIIPLEMEMVIPREDRLEQCESFNGNCVLIPNQVVEKIGINSDKYRHGFGDADYGFRAIEAKIAVVLTNFPVGICDKNPNAAIWNDIRYKAPIIQKYKVMTNIRCRPNSEWLYYTRRFGGKLWFLRFVMPYIKLIVSAVVSRL